MALDKQILDLSTETIIVDPLSTVTAYGAPTYSTANTSSYTVYVEPGARVVVNAQGIEEVAVATLFVLSSSAGVAVQDRITLPDSRQPRILRVDTINDEDGQHHLEILV
ncbi:MAG: hypothetical protein IIA60_07605 [Candidatus Marinimicrobia bacterium]|nr:hypothetical protein [Candidatus Neomarinimicrobiota bacterium]